MLNHWSNKNQVIHSSKVRHDIEDMYGSIEEETIMYVPFGLRKNPTNPHQKDDCEAKVALGMA